MISWTYLLFCAAFFALAASSKEGSFLGSRCRVAGAGLGPTIRPEFRIRGPGRFLRACTKPKRNADFAKRNETFRSAGRKLLESRWSPNQSFHGFVCFQWLDPVFVSLCHQGRGGGDLRGRKIALRQEPPPVSDPIGFAPSGRKTGRRFLAGGSQAGFAGEPAQPSPGGGRTTVRARSSHSANPFPEPALLAGRYRPKWPSEAELRPNPGDPLNAASLPLGRPIRTGARARIGVAASHRSYNALINL